MVGKLIERFQNKIQKLKPKQIIGGKCPTCGANIPKGEPFFCYWCKQALDYSIKE